MSSFGSRLKMLVQSWYVREFSLQVQVGPEWCLDSSGMFTATRPQWIL